MPVCVEVLVCVVVAAVSVVLACVVLPAAMWCIEVPVCVVLPAATWGIEVAVASGLPAKFASQTISATPVQSLRDRFYLL